MSLQENPGQFDKFSQSEKKEKDFLQREFGLRKVENEADSSGLAYISKIDGWAIEKESFLGRWLESAPVKRLRGVSQLGLNRYFPLPNFHTRFDHSSEVALRSVLELSRLARNFREEFLKMSADYPLGLNPQVLGKEEKDEQILKVIKLGAIYAINHDVATPAGGDGVKYIFDLDDDRDLLEVIKWNFEEYSRLCREDGFDPDKILALFTKLARREDEGILGQLIHRSGRKDRGFDMDSICYTLMDAQNCLGLDSNLAIKSRTTGESRVRTQSQTVESQLKVIATDLISQQDELNLQARDWLGGHERKLRELWSNGQSYSFLDLPSFRPQRSKSHLDLGDFIPFSALILKEGKVVFADPYVLDRLWLLHDFLAEHIYFSPATVGPEIGLAVSLKAERGEQNSLSEKEKRYILTVDDESFLSNLKKNFPNATYWCSDLASLDWKGGNLCRGSDRKILSISSALRTQDEIREQFTALFKIKSIPTRLETPVLILGEIKKYGEIFFERQKTMKQKEKELGYLMGTFPGWATPSSWVWVDEWLRPERHILERQPYWGRHLPP